MSAEHRPPRLATWLLDALLPTDEREPVVGDLSELFHRRLATNGLRSARAAFWRDALSAIVSIRASDSSPAARPIPGDGMLASFLADLRHAVRVLRRAPAFTIVCTLTLGLAIGATAAIYSIVDPVLLRPLPYPSPDRLAFIWERNDKGERDLLGFQTYQDLSQAQSLESSAVAGEWQPALTGEGAAERLDGMRVSAGFFHTLGVPMAIGRDFTAPEDQPDLPRVVILSHGLWARRYASDRSIIGRPISINGTPMVVIGVLPESFENTISPTAQLYRVLGYGATQPSACRTCRHLRMIARLKPGIEPVVASKELDQRFSRLKAAYPNDYGSIGTLVTPMKDEVTRGVRPVLLSVLGAVVLVLLIAVANVVNLQLARSARREGEFAIRTALGAGRRRLIQQLAAEGIVLAVMSGVAGVAVALWSLPLLVSRLPDRLPRLGDIHAQWSTLALAALVTALLGLAIGLAPTLRSAESTNFIELRSGARLAGGSRKFARRGIVVGEFALAMMLLVGAGLVARSLFGLLSVDPGFDESHLLTMEVDAIGARYSVDAPVLAFQDQVLAAVQAIPGVEGASFASQLPLSGNVDGQGVRAQDKPLANPELAPSADRYSVTADYMRTMKMRMISGRAFQAADNADSATKVVVVSETLAKTIWGGESPLGKQVQMGEPTQPWYTVVGVAQDVRHAGLDDPSGRQIYIPMRTWYRGAESGASLVLRTSGDPAQVTTAVRSAITRLDPAVPIVHLATMEQLVSASIVQRRLALVLFSAFAIVALLLAGAGIYGVIAGSVTERTRELGLRSALGAAPATIVRSVLAQGLVLASAGVVFGLVGALALSRFLQSLLFGIGPSDPPTLASVALLLGVIATISCLVPAVRASRIDPMTALRND
ncbi:MAG: efflux transporter, permease protein [Gemmatimonadetes bacterium]|nr:efflux transporter, permease protein [Gemmatimonadota bacterium]